MNVSAWFIRRPVATSLLMLGIFFVGMAAYTQLPIAGIPQVDIPTISVSTTLPGASAETIASSVTSPLERALAIFPRGEDFSGRDHIEHVVANVVALGGRRLCRTDIKTAIHLRRITGDHFAAQFFG